MPVRRPWESTYRYLIEGLNFAEHYAKEQGGTIRHGTIEPKPNEPRGEMFLPTTGHALGLIAMLNDPSFWVVNPELLQHEGMTNLTAYVAVAMAVHAGKLHFLHVGNQKPGQFDNDNPVLVGMDGVKEMVGVLWLLDRMNWQGYIEFDNHVLRTDCAPGKENSTRIRMDYIRQNVENYRMAEKKAQGYRGGPRSGQADVRAVGQGARHRQDPYQGRCGSRPKGRGGLRQGQRHRPADRPPGPAGNPAAPGDVRARPARPFRSR